MKTCGLWAKTNALSTTESPATSVNEIYWNVRALCSWLKSNEHVGAFPDLVKVMALKRAIKRASAQCKENEFISLQGVKYYPLTNRARGPYWGILARGRGSTDRAQRGPHCHDRRPIFPSTARASSVSKLFIRWHSASDSKIHFEFRPWLALKGLPPWRILNDASNSDKSKLLQVRKTNSLNVKSS